MKEAAESIIVITIDVAGRIFSYLYPNPSKKKKAKKLEKRRTEL